MNKKVLTLCAGFVLAGGMLSSLSAEQLSKVANDGKYYKIGRLSNYDSSSNTWGEASGSYCLDLNEGKAGLTQEGPTNYWRVAKASEDGMYHLINMKGDTLYVNTHKTFGFNEDLPGNNGTKVPYTQLYYMEDGKQVWVSHESQNPTGFYALGVQGEDLNVTPGIAFDAMKDTDNTALKNALLEEGVDALYMFCAAGDVENAIRTICEDASTSDKEKLAKVNAVIYISESEGVTPNQAIVLGDAAIPADINYSFIKIAANGTVTASAQNVNWGEYKPFDGKSNKFVMAYNHVAIRATKINDEVSYIMGTYDPSEAVSSEYHWTLVPVETGTKNDYHLRIQDAFGNYLAVGNEYIYVDGVNVTKDTNGNWLYDGQKMDGETNVFFPELTLRVGDGYATYDAGSEKFVKVANASSAKMVGAATIDVAYMYAGDLLKRGAEYFTFQIEYDKDADGEYETDLTSIFDGELTPVQWNDYQAGSNWYSLASPKETSFMLINEDKKILALNIDKAWSAGNGDHAYTLELISAETYNKALKAEQINGDPNPYCVYFSFEYTPGNDASTLQTITNVWVGKYWNSKEYALGCYLDKNVPTLAAAYKGTLKDVKFILNASSAVNPEAWLNKPVYYTVAVKNVYKKHPHYGKVLGLDEYGDVNLVAPTKTDLEKPEGQFAITYEKGIYTLTNRETGKTATMTASDLYNTNTTNVFAYRNASTGYAMMDTLLISPISNYSSADGFKSYKAADLNANTYTVALKAIGGDVYVVENHNDKHRIGLDETEATDWRIEAPTVKVMDIVGDFDRYSADTVTITTPIKYYVAGKGWQTTNADDPTHKYYYPNTALKIATYILKNTATDEYISGDSDKEEAANSYYYCPSKTEATRFALKIVGDTTVNLIPVYNYSWVAEYADGKSVNTSNWVANAQVSETNYDYYTSETNMALSSVKVIGGVSADMGILKDVNRFQATANDLFVIENSEAPTYKKLKQGDKIVLARQENQDQVVYEKGSFLSIDNIKAYGDINPTLYVDSAATTDNFAYQYLLAVRAIHTDEIEDCGNPNHEHPRTVFTDGDFLVVMRDSMEANTDVHNNIYAYNDQPKLAFVSGIHQNDTLYYTNKAGEVIAKSEVGNNAYNFAKFAFKMVDEDANEFVVETGYDYVPVKWVNGDPVEYEVSKGYLRWVNGNLVVTDNIDEAAHFTMETSDKEATANETIAAGNVVVAGVNGAVVVKGAEGKNVIVSTILGKVVANEVVSSDNAQIATPAGIVVVSVDGESFKVVVK